MAATAAATRTPPRRQRQPPNAPQDDMSAPCPYEVLGVALVVDQLGKGARMVFRYPTTASISSSPQQQSSSNSSSTSTTPSDDLFFRLPSRQMAKLFRPKPALCGQPMTLTVGGTVFICCSTLMMEPPTQPTQQPQDGSDPAKATAKGSTTTVATHPDDKIPASNEGLASSGADINTGNSSGVTEDRPTLVLFSVIVALVAPSGAPQLLPLSAWRMDEKTRSHHDKNRHGLGTGASSSTLTSASESFLCIRRVHVSLARLCRVLAREERRCRYVSLQAEQFQMIRGQLQKRWKQEQAEMRLLESDRDRHQRGQSSTQLVPPHHLGSLAGSSSVVSAAAAATVMQGGGGIMSNNISPGPVTNASGTASASASAGASEPRKRGHRKGTSFGRGENPHHDAGASTTDGPGGSSTTAAGDDIIPEVEQEVVEVIMASRPAGEVIEAEIGNGNNADMGSRQVHWRSHRGNLARELAQVFHALGRNGGGGGNRNDFAPSPADLLTGKSGVVYVNRHIAVPIEPLCEYRPFASSSSPSSITIRPYHTLLFPLATPEQLLEGLQEASAGSSDFRRLQQLLIVASPLKDVTEMSSDANVPIPKAMELATYLVSQGACVASPVINRSTRLVCRGVDRIRDAALPFSQAFGPSVNLFALVSYLTQAGRTLGELMHEIGGSTTPIAMPIRQATTTPTLSDPRHVALLREGLESSLDAQMHMFARPAHGTSALADATHVPFRLGSATLYGDPMTLPHENLGRTMGMEELDEPRHSPEQLEGMLLQMATWLRSRQVLNHLVEFIVACLPMSGGGGRIRSSSATNAEESNDDDDDNRGGGDRGDSSGSGRRTRDTRGSGDSSNDSADRGGEASEKKVDGSRRHRSAGFETDRDADDDDDALFQELFESGCLDGHTSIQHCCYRLGLESASRLRAFANRHPRIRIVTREPTDRDDW